MNTFKFTKLKPFKLWAEFQGLQVVEIERGLKNINKHNGCIITLNDSKVNGLVVKSPIPQASSNSL